MSIDNIRDKIPDFGRDIRLNLGTILTAAGAPGLTQTQILGAALASAYTTKSAELTQAILQQASAALTDADVTAAKSAATTMAMNNVYYRSMHLLEDPGIKQLPARLRMNVIANPGVPKLDFEIYCLSVSAISGCGMCLNAHVAELKKAGLTDEGCQSAIRIGAVINAAAQALAILG